MKNLITACALFFSVTAFAHPCTVPNPSTASLQSAGYIPYYKPTTTTFDVAKVVPYPGTIMPHMNVAGERQDIGYLPEWAVLAIVLGDESRAWQQTLINADAAATFAWHIDDPATGTPLSLDLHPKVTLDSRFPGTLYVDPNKASMTTKIDDAHQPQLTYFPFLKTNDFKYLRELQYQANWHMMSHGSSNGLGLLINSQMRGFAWTLRQIALAAVATKKAEMEGNLPSNLLPSDYFYRKLENNRRWIEEQTILSINPATQAFRVMFPFYDTQVGFWQSDFIVGVIGQIVRLGFTNWKPIFDWGMVGVKIRAAGSNGWTKADPSSYYVNLRATATDPVELTWAGLVRVNKLDPNATVLKNPAGGYYNYVVGNLAIAASLGDTEAMVPYNRLVTELKGQVSVKWAFDPAPRPVVLKQPVVSADPHYVSFRRMVTDNMKVPDLGFFSMIKTAEGQTIKSPFSKHIGRVLSMPDYAYVKNASSGGGFETNVAFIDFGAGDIYDVKAGAWKPK